MMNFSGKGKFNLPYLTQISPSITLPKCFFFFLEGGVLLFSILIFPSNLIYGPIFKLCKKKFMSMLIRTGFKSGLFISKRNASFMPISLTLGFFFSLIN